MQEMQTPRGAPLINFPPVINGGGPRRRVAEGNLLEVNQSRMLGRMMKGQASGQANSLALNWLVRFGFLCGINFHHRLYND